MNLLNVVLAMTFATVALAQGWPNLVKAWIQAKVLETKTGQTQT